MLYDVTPEEHAQLVKPSPNNNIYVRIPHALQSSLPDPVLQNARFRLQKFVKAGCIDFVAETADNSLVLFDWKRTKQLRAKYNNPWRCTQAPLGHLPDCAGWHYRLQLNTYKFLLQQYYGRSVSAMYVVCLHPDNADTGPFIDDVPDMTQKVVAMVSTWQELSGGAEPSGGSQCSFDARVAAEVEAGMDMASSDAAAAAIRSADGAALQSQEMVLALSLMNGEETQDVGNEEALALPCSGLPAEAVASAKKDA